ncbi:MAG: hypothetical protein K2F97_00035 [Muribaculaceae bacterium]|nr:hypothetical protein [Muribaculaceae bacterium]MDE6487126.1 hypothetical protein [Muribaculaceae bacterium]
MLKNLKITLLAVAAVMAAAMASCFGDDNNTGGGTLPPDNTFYSFATYNGTSGSVSSFDVQRPGDGTPATITFNMAFTDAQLKAGTRVYIAYTTASGQQYQSGPGTLYSVTKVDGGVPVPATESNSPGLSTPVKMDEMTRTGDYLNMVFRMSAVNNLTHLQLTEKDNTKDPAYPILGLYVLTDSEDGTYKYFRASFDIEDVLEPAEVKGVKVAYFGDNGIDTLTFVKSNAGTIVPTPND